MNASELRSTIILGSIFALRMLGLFMIIPVFSIYGRDYTSSTPMLIGIAVGIYGLAQAILQIPVSMMAETINRKKLIIIGLILFTLGGAVSAMATDIWQVILGRLLAGAGAISAVIMALLADVTREQNRSKAMATMGLMIGGSIFLAFILGPILVGWVGISGLFWLTSGAGVLGMFLVALVPNPVRSKSYFYTDYLDKGFSDANKNNTNKNSSNENNARKNQAIKKVGVTSIFIGLLKQALMVRNVKPLFWSVFTLHLLMTAIFVLTPIELEKMGFAVHQHAYVYLPLLFVGFVLAIPMIIVAEKYRKMKQVFVSAMVLITVGLLIVFALYGQFWALAFGLAVFFIGFNLLEALIPSWLSKQAPIQVKNTVMGVSSSSQFCGAFLGGSLGGVLMMTSPNIAWLICAGIALLAVVIISRLSQPPYLTSISVNMGNIVEDMNLWQQHLLDINGVEDVVVLASDGVAYIKIDKKKLNEQSKQKLTNLIKQKLDF